MSGLSDMGLRTSYIAAGTTIPNHPNTLTNSRRATAAVASNNAFRSASVSVKI